MNFAKICIALSLFSFCEVSFAGPWPSKGELELFFAALSGPLPELNAQLLRNPFLAMASLEDSGTTAMHVAAANGLGGGVVELLLSYGANVNAMKKDGTSVLRLATNRYGSGIKKDPQVIFLLLESGAHLNPIANDCKDSHFCALGHRDFNVLWEYGSQCEHDFSPGLSLAWSLVKSTDSAIVWLRNLEAIQLLRENDIREIYRISAARGRTERVKGLIKRYGHMLRVEDHLHALSRAVARKRAETCGVLLARLFALEKSTEEKEAVRQVLRRLLRCATMNRDDGIVKLLNEANAEDDLATQWQESSRKAYVVQSNTLNDIVAPFQLGGAPSPRDVARLAAGLDTGAPLPMAYTAIN